MRISRILQIALAVGSLSATVTQAQLFTPFISVAIGENTNAGTGVVGPDLVTPLTSGDPSTAGDGAIVQLGYFSASSPSDLFAGEFVALTGIGGLNSAFGNTSVGDDPSEISTILKTGWAYFTVQFETTDPSRNQGLPAAGTFLAVRFFNCATLEASTHFNTISSSDSQWAWVAPSFPAPSSFLELTDYSNIVWQDAANPGATTIAVPEPAAYAALLGMATLGLVAMRRRRS